MQEYLQVVAFYSLNFYSLYISQLFQLADNPKVCFVNKNLMILAGYDQIRKCSRVKNRLGILLKYIWILHACGSVETFNNFKLFISFSSVVAGTAFLSNFPGVLGKTKTPRNIFYTKKYLLHQEIFFKPRQFFFLCDPRIENSNKELHSPQVPKRAAWPEAAPTFCSGYWRNPCPWASSRRTSSGLWRPTARRRR